MCKNKIIINKAEKTTTTTTRGIINTNVCFDCHRQQNKSSPLRRKGGGVHLNGPGEFFKNSKKKKKERKEKNIYIKKGKTKIRSRVLGTEIRVRF